MVLGWSPFRILSGVVIDHPIWLLLLKIEKRGVVSKKIFSSKTAEPIYAKLW